MRRQPKSLGSAFNSLLAGSLITNVGDGIRLTALPLLATELTSSPFLISVVTSAQFLPWLTFAPVGGVVVDRWDRRRTILATQAWRGLVMAALAALVVTDVVALWQLYLVAFVITVGEILVDPSVVAIVPTLVDDEQLDTANGRIASAEIVTNEFAGGPLGATAFGLAPWLPFVIDSLSYLGSLVPFRRLPSNVARRRDGGHSVPGTGCPARPSLRSEAAEGFRWLRRHRILGPLTATTVVYYFGATAAISLMVVLVTAEVGASPLAFGLVLAMGALGAALGSLFGSGVASAIGVRLVLTSATVLQGLALIGMALTDSVAVMYAIWFLHGLPGGARIPVMRAMQQRLTPNHLLGRVNIASRMFTRGVIILGALVAGAIASATNVRWSFGLGGAVVIATGGLIWIVLGRSSDDEAVT